MSKQLPYFKFTCDEWLTGDISLEDFSVQGLFVNICAYYWKQDCSVTMAKLRQRYRRAKSSHFDTLIDNKILKTDKYDNARITFLDEQLAELKEQYETKAENGRKGAEKRWQDHSNTIVPLKSANGKSIEDIDIDKEIDIDKNKDMDFINFWDKYHKTTKLPRTDMGAAKKYFIPLSKKEKEKAIENIQSYYNSLSDKKYCKKARTYLRDKNFNDEFIPVIGIHSHNGNVKEEYGF